MGQVNIQSSTIWPLSWVWYDPKMSREFGYFSPLSTLSWEAAGAALAANGCILRYFILKFQTSFPDSHTSLSRSSNSTTTSSEVPATACLHRHYSSFSLNICMWKPISKWSLTVERNCFVYRLVISSCRPILCEGWLCTLGSGPVGSMHSRFYSSTWWCSVILTMTSSNQMLTFVLSLGFLSFPDLPEAPWPLSITNWIRTSLRMKYSYQLQVY